MASEPDTVDDAPPPPQSPKPSVLPPRQKPLKIERSLSSGASSTDTTSNNNEEVWTPRNSFTADSPYFTAFCDNEVKQLHVLSDSLREIANRTQTLTKTGMIMSEAAQRLAASCKFHVPSVAPEDETPEQKEERLAAVRQHRLMRKQAVGDEMASFLEILGDVSIDGSLVL